MSSSGKVSYGALNKSQKQLLDRRRLGTKPGNGPMVIMFFILLGLGTNIDFDCVVSPFTPLESFSKYLKLTWWHREHDNVKKNKKKLSWNI